MCPTNTFMMFNLPYIPTADFLVDKAFRRGSAQAKMKRSTRKGDREVRLRKSEIERVKAVSASARSDLKAIIKNFPSYEQLPSFYQRLLDIRIDKDRYKKSLGAVQWCLKQIDRLEQNTLKDIRIERDTSHVKSFLGRISSVIKQISSDLDELIEIKMSLRDFPEIADQPTLVIAGYPNVGKSTFLRNLTGAKVKVAAYPFTTQEILIGHRKIRYLEYQVIDTPGLLDRSMAERNKIERQAILAISELADFILFIFDPMQDKGAQKKLLSEIRAEFDIEIQVVLNKKDAADPAVLESLTDELGLSRESVISAKDEADCVRIFKGVFAK